jgi:hypothetical protein
MGSILVPFKKFLSNRNTITILGVLLGIVVLYLGYNWRVNKSIKPTEIPFSTATLQSTTKITSDVIGYTKVPKDMIKNMTNLETNVNKINGMLVSYDSKIPKNGFFFSENLIKEEDMPDSIFTNIQDGYTIYALKVDNDLTYGNAIFPEDMIDLYLSSKDEENKIIYGRLIKSIQVIAVRDKKGKNVFQDKDNPTESALLLFAVPEKIFLLLKKAEKLKIDIEPIPRNKSYSTNAQATELTNDELTTFITNQTHALNDECEDLLVCG